MSKTDKNYTIDDLQYLMQRLREPKYGCPWDLAQNQHFYFSSDVLMTTTSYKIVV